VDVDVVRPMCRPDVSPDVSPDVTWAPVDFPETRSYKYRGAAMHNMFITRGFDWANGGSRKVQLGNSILGRLGLSARLVEPGSTGYMTCVEQRANLYHLVSQVLSYGVEGDLVEVGTFTGQTATLIGRVLAGEGNGQRLHVYDSFGSAWDVPDPRQTLELNFRSAGVPLPQIHKGLFQETLPSQLPDKIAFANLDIGFGGREERAEEHASLLIEVLGHVYERMPRGAIGSLIDYWDDTLHAGEVHENYGVTRACQRFFADKRERVSVLYAGSFTQGYFRKL
jgi:O-methyltransferase